MRCKACNDDMSAIAIERTYPTGEHIDLCDGCYRASSDHCYDQQRTMEVIVEGMQDCMDDGTAWALFLSEKALMCQWSEGLWGFSAERALGYEEEAYTKFLALRAEGMQQRVAMERAARTYLG